MTLSKQQKPMNIQYLLFFAGLFITTGCTIVTIPVTIVNEQSTMHGTMKAGAKSMTFRVSDKKSTCTGKIDMKTKKKTITMLMNCDDDRHGYATMTFDPRTQTAVGKVRMNDGKESKIRFGIDKM